MEDPTQNNIIRSSYRVSCEKDSGEKNEAVKTVMWVLNCEAVKAITELLKPQVLGKSCQFC